MLYLRVYSEYFWISILVDTMVYESTPETLNDQRLAADLSPDLALTSQWGKNTYLHSMPRYRFNANDNFRLFNLK